MNDQKTSGEPAAWLAQAVGKGGEVYRNKASTIEPTMRDIEIAWGQGVIDRFTIVIKPLYAGQPAPVALTQDAIDRIVPSLNPEPDRDEFHCEWALWSDRERIRNKLSTLLTANRAPVAVVMPERKRAHCTGAISDFRTWEEAQGWNACLDEVKRLNR